MRLFVPFAVALLVLTRLAASATVLVEAESFSSPGGWSLDTQFIREMGSPYSLAHGLGKPVADATTKVAIPAAGTYRVFVRTKDWVARWSAPGSPGKFLVIVNGKPLAETFGTKGAQWDWHDGVTVALRISSDAACGTCRGLQRGSLRIVPHVQIIV